MRVDRSLLSLKPGWRNEAGLGDDCRFPILSIRACPGLGVGYDSGLACCNARGRESCVPSGEKLHDADGRYLPGLRQVAARIHSFYAPAELPQW